MEIKIPPETEKLLRFLPLGLLAALVGITALTMFYTVPAESVGVVLRFGKFQNVVNPGLRVKFPYGIDRVTEVPVKRQLKQEFGFGTTGATNSSQFSSDQREQLEERSMVSGDLNAALVEWVVQYRIKDPKAYLFNVRRPEITLRDASESVMREVVGDRTVDEVITFGRQGIEIEALEKLQALVNKYELGLGIDQVQLKDVDPPEQVQASFNEVNQAQQERERSINIAKGEYNKLVPRTEGEAKQKISEAEGYATQRVNEAEGDAAHFQALFAEYSKAPAVTKQRLYLETMAEIAPTLGKKIVIDESVKGVLPLLNLNEAAKQ